jgi:Arc/MetJ family transcription regulator
MQYAYNYQIVCITGIIMRTTLDLPQALLEEAMRLTNIMTKTNVIKAALQNLIQKEKISGLKKYRGKVDLQIDLDILRSR